MTYAKVIVNPAAGAGKTARHWPDILACLRSSGLDFDYSLTTAPNEAAELARSAGVQGYSLVVAVGGDGTISEVANGLFLGNCLDRVALGIVSSGTGSDYVRTIGAPRDYREACQCLSSPGRLLVDIGVVECLNGGNKVSRIFLNSAGLGMDAEIAQSARKFKVLGAKMAYMAGFFKAFIAHRNRELKLKLDQIEETVKACSVLVSNGRYGGGGMCPVPDAELTDGRFDVLVVGDVAKPAMLRLLPRFYDGTHIGHPKVSIRRAAEVEVHPLQPMPVQADGELLGEGPARFKILPAALNLVIQQPGTARSCEPQAGH